VLIHPLSDPLFFFSFPFVSCPHYSAARYKWPILVPSFFFLPPRHFSPPFAQSFHCVNRLTPNELKFRIFPSISFFFFFSSSSQFFLQLPPSFQRRRCIKHSRLFTLFFFPFFPFSSFRRRSANGCPAVLFPLFFSFFSISLGLWLPFLGLVYTVIWKTWFSPLFLFLFLFGVSPAK